MSITPSPTPVTGNFLDRIFPLGEHMFEDLVVPIPRRIKDYMERIYGRLVGFGWLVGWLVGFDWF